ncbi:MAG: hypothetical protein H7259_08495 [Cytophagales bacterium]|nr:hypothetical protein [Cytophaga sp.]
MIIDSSIKEQVLWQKKTYHYIHLYGRSQLKEEMEAVYRRLVSEPEYKSFRQKIASIFSK